MGPITNFSDTTLMQRIAKDNHQVVTASVGKVVGMYPIEIMSAEASIAAQFKLQGGLGYVPVRFKGLKRHDGWQLEKLTSGSWKKVNQSVHGSDFWQSNFDSLTGTWTLTYNLANRGVHTYRLRFVGR